MTLKRLIAIAVGAAAVVFLIKWLTGRRVGDNLVWEPEKPKVAAAA